MRRVLFIPNESPSLREEPVGVHERSSGLLVPYDEGNGLPPDAYRGKTGQRYKPPDGRFSRTIPVLEFLAGKPWDEDALGLVHALRPSMIRVTTGIEDCMSVPWRVTVVVDEAGVIKKIDQQVEIGITNPVKFQERYNAAIKAHWDAQLEYAMNYWAKAPEETPERADD